MLGYIVEVKQEGLDKPGSWTELANCCKNTSYHVRSGLEPLGHYRFRVRAYNLVGVSEPSKVSKCVKMATTSKQFLKEALGFLLYVGGVYLYFCVFEEAKTEEPEPYVTVTIDTKNKVTDHYNVHEKLGV